MDGWINPKFPFSNDKTIAENRLVGFMLDEILNLN
jgi:hypothetical protein